MTIMHNRRITMKNLRIIMNNLIIIPKTLMIIMHNLITIMQNLITIMHNLIIIMHHLLAIMRRLITPGLEARVRGLVEGYRELNELVEQAPRKVTIAASEYAQGLGCHHPHHPPPSSHSNDPGQV